jgi:hypothetical protein
MMTNYLLDIVILLSPGSAASAIVLARFSKWPAGRTLRFWSGDTTPISVEQDDPAQRGT